MDQPNKQVIFTNQSSICTIPTSHLAASCRGMKWTLSYRSKLRRITLVPL